MKIFLAGNDGDVGCIPLHVLGYPYRLSSYYALRGSASNRALTLECVKHLPPDGEWIMDSGLFSLMFGSEKDTLKGYDAFRGYAETYLADMKAWGWKHTIVECDTQRVLGIPETHKLRDELFRPSGFDVIYVWHIPEGEEGLTELARKDRRVALSVPEFRNVLGRGSKVHAAILQGLRLIRAAKRNDQRVHLLGNTEAALLSAPLPADTCDSTSWLAGGQYGNGQYFDRQREEVVTASVYSPKWRAWREWCEQAFAPSFALLRQYTSLTPDKADKRWSYYGNNLCSAIAYVLWMEHINGEPVKLVVPTTLPTRYVKTEGSDE